MEAKTGITFSDVAGIDGQEELKVVTFLKQPERFTAIRRILRSSSSVLLALVKLCWLKRSLEKQEYPF